jgi:hypothetical protein
MHIEFLVEEYSVERVLRCLLPRMLPEQVTFEIHPHQGKPDLLSKLPGKLAGYARWMPPDWCICILVDQDEDDCLDLKGTITRIASRAGVRALVRIAVKELESWFFGDAQAIHQAYPRVSCTLDRRAKYRNPDAIRGGHGKRLNASSNGRATTLAGCPRLRWLTT